MSLIKDAAKVLSLNVNDVLIRLGNATEYTESLGFIKKGELKASFDEVEGIKTACGTTLGTMLEFKLEITLLQLLDLANYKTYHNKYCDIKVTGKNSDGTTKTIEFNDILVNISVKELNFGNECTVRLTATKQVSSETEVMTIALT